MNAFELPVGLAEVLDRTYEFERELGGGGMSRVFLARETALGRRVVIKVLPNDLLSGPARERFRREILIAARLQHPHIVPLLATGSAEGQPFFVMPFIEGETLRDRLVREGSLPCGDAVAIAREVAGALDYAHREGIVHRDVKPENILLSRGHALVADFGVARPLTPPAGGELTEAGLAVGTPAYMSPEQMVGEGQVSGRADVYALGCVLYEMLAGTPPFAGATIHAMLAHRLSGKVPPIPSDRGVPAGTEAAIHRAIAPDPADRFGFPAEFAAALDAVGGAVPSARTIAVLPLASQGTGEANQLFADGLSEEIATDLSRVKAFRVTSRSSAAKYRSLERDVRTIGRELGVRYLLTGSVRTVGNDLRVAVQLVDAVADTELWADRFSGTLEDVFAIQEEIARRVVRALEVRLSPDEDRRMGTRGLRNPEAWQHWLRARRLNASFDPAQIEQAIAFVDRAIALEGEQSSLLALKGYILWNLWNTGGTGKDGLEQARPLIERALVLDPDDATALVARAMLEGNAPRVNCALLLRLLSRAWESERSEDACMWLALYLTLTGRAEEGLRYARHLRELDPLSPGLAAFESLALWNLGRLDEAQAVSAAMFAQAGEDPLIRFHHLLLLTGAGRFEDATAMPSPSQPANLWDRVDLLHHLALAGDREALRTALTDDALTAQARIDNHFSFFVARAAAHAGLLDEAMTWMWNAARRGMVDAALVDRHDRMLAPLRAHAEYGQLLAFMREEAARIARESGF